jgi:hypothetical protein
MIFHYHHSPAKNKPLLDSTLEFAATIDSTGLFPISFAHERPLRTFCAKNEKTRLKVMNEMGLFSSRKHGRQPV